jgi:hypothetical protein
MDLKNGTKNRGQRSTPDPPQIDHKSTENRPISAPKPRMLKSGFQGDETRKSKINETKG